MQTLSPNYNEIIQINDFLQALEAVSEFDVLLRDQNLPHLQSNTVVQDTGLEKQLD